MQLSWKAAYSVCVLGNSAYKKKGIVQWQNTQAKEQDLKRTHKLKITAPKCNKCHTMLNMIKLMVHKKMLIIACRCYNGFLLYLVWIQLCTVVKNFVKNLIAIQLFWYKKVNQYFLAPCCNLLLPSACKIHFIIFPIHMQGRHNIRVSKNLNSGVLIGKVI